VERIFCLERYRKFRTNDGSIGGLVDFHAAHKIQLMAHNQSLLRKMGSLVAHAREVAPDDLLARYEEILLTAMKRKAKPRSHTNALMHMMGYFKKQLTADEKQELLEVIDQYKQELVPLMVPVTLVAHYVRKYDERYLARQTYLNPHPVEFKLRNHA
jgi:uncharacterized protein YbgA (DUF1722 family)